MLSVEEIIAGIEATENSGNKISIIPEPDFPKVRERGGTSIDLRLGRWFRSFKQDQTISAPLVSSVNISGDQSNTTSRTRQHFVRFGKGFVLHPGRFVLGSTLEWIRLPKNLSGYVSGKSSLGRHGLIIETAAGIHPNFSGCLTLELTNVGEIPLQIYPGMQICQIFLHRTNPQNDSDIGQFSGSRKPSIIPPKKDETFDRLTREN